MLVQVNTVHNGIMDGNGMLVVCGGGCILCVVVFYAWCVCVSSALFSR